MNTDRYEKVKEVFSKAIDLPADERAAFLDAACKGDEDIRDEVMSLLSHDAPSDDAFSDQQMAVMRSALEEAVGSNATDATAFSASTIIDAPKRVGQYEVLRVLGHGGMGVVYEARQANPQRTVALKVIRPGLSTRRIMQRFEHEAQALGRLQHPGIAHIYEAGVADIESDGHGRSRQPFIAMELVRGQSLVRHVRDNDLPTNTRLALLAKVCDAVQHAHVQGVIHRDLKPSNILVDAEGEPKILDFGVARLTDSDVQVTTLHTDVGQLVGTLPYMSPEQVSADSSVVDTRSDVYALGVILYEMISGELPLDVRARSIPEAVQVIQNSEPTRLSSYSTVYRGDIETIVAKALEKDPLRRYQSAGELAADLRRHLANQPISARPPSAMYQFRKFARRNQAAVIGAVAVLLVLVVGVITTTTGMVRAQRAEAEAQSRLKEAQAARLETEAALTRAQSAEAEAQSRLKEAQSAHRATEAVNEFLNQILYAADPARHDGREMSVREALDEAANRVEGFAEDSPLVKAEIYLTIGTTYQRIGQYRAGTPHFRSALELQKKFYGPHHPRTVETTSMLGQNLFLCGDLDESEALLTESSSAVRQFEPINEQELAYQLCTLGRIHKRRASYPAAIAYLREAIELHRKRGPTAGGLSDALIELGAVLSREAQYEEAEALQREAVEIQRKVHGPESAHLGGTLTSLAVTLKRRDKFEEAEAVNREALKIVRATHGLNHPATLTTMVNLGGLLAERGSHAEAEALFREALPVSREIHGADGFQVGIACARLADVLRRQGKLTDAEEFAREGVGIFERSMGEHPYTARAKSELGSILNERQQHAPAAQLFEEAAHMYLKTVGEEHPVYPDTLTLLAVSKRELGEVDEANKRFAEAESLMLADFDSVKDTDDRADQVRAQLAEHIAEFYATWGNQEHADAWRTRQHEYGSAGN